MFRETNKQTKKEVKWKREVIASLREAGTAPKLPEQTWHRAVFSDGLLHGQNERPLK